MLNLGERIRKLRIANNMTQEELANLIGYTSRSTISKIELDGRGVPIDTLLLIAKALNVSVSALVEENTDCDSVFSDKLSTITKSLETLKAEDLDKVSEYIEFLKFK